MIQIRRRTVVLSAAAIVLVAVVATASLVLTLTRTAGAGNTFSDTPPWIKEHADWLSSNGIATGYPDGTFRPNQNITRGQSAFWLGNYNDNIELVYGNVNYAGSGTEFSLYTQCPVGKRAVAAGHEIDAPWVLQASRPDDGFPDRWKSTFVAPVTEPLPLAEAWVVCVPNTVN